VVGLLGGELGQAQLLVLGRLVGDVAGDHQQAAAERGQGPAVRLKGEPVPVGVADPQTQDRRSRRPEMTSRWAWANGSRSSGWMTSPLKASWPTLSLTG
jgi:hypothetical protein